MSSPGSRSVRANLYLIRMIQTTEKFTGRVSVAVRGWPLVPSEVGPRTLVKLAPPLGLLKPGVFARRNSGPPVLPPLSIRN